MSFAWCVRVQHVVACFEAQPRTLATPSTVLLLLRHHKECTRPLTFIHEAARRQVRELIYRCSCVVPRRGIYRSWCPWFASFPVPARRKAIKAVRYQCDLVDGTCRLPRRNKLSSQVAPMNSVVSCSRAPAPGRRPTSFTCTNSSRKEQQQQTQRERLCACTHQRSLAVHLTRQSLSLRPPLSLSLSMCVCLVVVISLCCCRCRCLLLLYSIAHRCITACLPD